MTFSPGMVLGEVFRLKQGLVGKDFNAFSLEGNRVLTHAKQKYPHLLCVSELQAEQGLVHVLP